MGGVFPPGQLRTFPAPPLKDTSPEKPSLLYSPLSPVYQGPWAALIRGPTTECLCVCVCVCLSVCLSVCGRGVPWERAGARDSWVPMVAPQTRKHPTNVGMSVGGGISSQSEGPAGGPGVAGAGPPPLPLARVQDEALLNPANTETFGSHVAHSLLPPGLQSDPGPGLGLLTHQLSAWQPGLPLLGLRARCQPRRPPVLSLPTVREGRQLAGGVGLPPGPLGSPPPWPPYSLSLGWAAEVAHPLEPPAWLCGQGALSPPWGRCLSQRERVRPVLPLPRADPGPQGPRFPP